MERLKRAMESLTRVMERLIWCNGKLDITRAYTAGTSEACESLCPGTFPGKVSMRTRAVKTRRDIAFSHPG
jgi:hypothetical protein